ncbi:MAG: DUF2800 domain-containing protein [Parvibaculaceae bacterium]
MVDHGARDHATWAASATARNWACSGALALALEITVPERENEAAAWGTACHQLSEMSLRSGKPADDFLGMAIKTKEHEFEVDEEMAETAQVYVDYVTKRAAEALAEGGWVEYEKNFSLARLSPPFDAGGTADATIYFPKQRLLEVVDLKGGRGVRVEVHENKQARSYALGVVLNHRGLDVEKVKSTIVQPRMPHKDGRTRSETYHVVDLMEWTAELLVAMERAKIAIAARKAPDFVEGAWATQFLSAGDHCKFCRAAGNCPALERKAWDAVGLWFDDLDQPRISNDPRSGTPAEIAASLDAMDMIQEWMNARRAYAHEIAETGVEIPDYILVPRQAREKWNEGAEDMVLAAAKAAGLSADKYLNPAKLRTPKQVRKALGAKKEKLVAGLSSTPNTGSNLVRANKTTREAVAASVHRHFTPIED